MKKTILVVDDEPEIADLIEVYLTTDEWRKPAIKNYLTAGFHPVEYDVGMPERWAGVFAEMGIEPVPLQKL